MLTCLGASSNLLPLGVLVVPDGAPPVGGGTNKKSADRPTVQVLSQKICQLNLSIW